MLANEGALDVVEGRRKEVPADPLSHLPARKRPGVGLCEAVLCTGPGPSK
jgi:hypothetical protein